MSRLRGGTLPGSINDLAGCRSILRPDVFTLWSFYTIDGRLSISNLTSSKLSLRFTLPKSCISCEFWAGANVKCRLATEMADSAISKSLDLRKCACSSVSSGTCSAWAYSSWDCLPSGVLMLDRFEISLLSAACLVQLSSIFINDFEISCDSWLSTGLAASYRRIPGTRSMELLSSQMASSLEISENSSSMLLMTG